VVSPQEDETMWIKFANLCRKSGRFNLTQKTLATLFEHNPETADKTILSSRPWVTYSFLKFLWHSGQKDKAFEKLTNFTEHALMLLKENEQAERIDPKLLARCYLKLGEWKRYLSEDSSVSFFDSFFFSFLAQTQLSTISLFLMFRSNLLLR